jgi:hypothetical protein
MILRVVAKVLVWSSLNCHHVFYSMLLAGNHCFFVVVQPNRAFEWTAKKRRSHSIITFAKEKDEQ